MTPLSRGEHPTTKDTVSVQLTEREVRALARAADAMEWSIAQRVSMPTGTALSTAHARLVATAKDAGIDLEETVFTEEVSA